MKWLKLTVLTTTLASDIVSQLLISEGSAGVMIEDNRRCASAGCNWCRLTKGPR